MLLTEYLKSSFVNGKFDSYKFSNNLLNDPIHISNISYELSKLIINDKNKQKFYISAMSLNEIPFAFSIAQIKNLSLLSDESVVNNNLIIIATTIEISKILINNKIDIYQILCIFDTESGDIETLSEMGYNIKSLFKISDILKHKEDIPKNITLKNPITRNLLEIIKLKQSNLVVSLDITNEEELLNKLNQIGEHICAVKIHYDIISNPSTNFYTKINVIKQNKNFLIIEDRKFADIPFISTKQLTNLKQFADIITVHGICGEKLIDELNKMDIGILSIENNLIDNIYSNKVKDMANNFSNVVGFISQRKVLDDYLTFTPGINLETKTDNIGQTYRNMSDCHTDIFIVGRGIYESIDIIESTIRYKELCFKRWNYP